MVWKVIAGGHDFSLDNEPHRVVRESTEVYMHPAYNTDLLTNDIGLIRLQEKIPFNGKHVH
jgi:hypothetical protein